MIAFTSLLSQNVLIKGKAHKSYIGKVIQVFSTQDYITNTQQKENQDTIDADGYFEFSIHTEYTKPVYLKIENAVAQLYVQPDFVYGITFPEINDALNYQNDAELPVNIGVVGADSMELNMLTYDYQELYNQYFIPKDNRFLTRPEMFKRADSLKIECDKKYAKIKNTYFKTYVDYSIASINASVSRGENYLIRSYILNKKIQYHHNEYMQFFNVCFKGYLNTVATSHKGQSLYNIINVKANYGLLNDFLKKDVFLKNDSLRELVVIKNLWDFYFAADFVPTAVETIITQLNLQTKIKEHKLITNTMLAYFNKMQIGSVAPMFSARSKDGTIASLNSYKGKWIYLSFFSTKNTESLKEMAKIAALKKKYGDKVNFISVCLDDSVKNYITYLKNNPKFDWQIWFSNEKSIGKTAKENYFVTGTEAYYLINNFGYLAQSPALSPSQGIEFNFNILFKRTQRTTKTGIR